MDRAIAILRAGRSFDEAAKITGLSIESIMKAWNDSITNEEQQHDNTKPIRSKAKAA